MTEERTTIVLPIKCSTVKEVYGFLDKVMDCELVIAGIVGTACFIKGSYELIMLASNGGYGIINWDMLGIWLMTYFAAAFTALYVISKYNAILCKIPRLECIKDN